MRLIRPNHIRLSLLMMLLLQRDPVIVKRVVSSIAAIIVYTFLAL